MSNPQIRVRPFDLRPKQAVKLERVCLDIQWLFMDLLLHLEPPSDTSLCLPPEQAVKVERVRAAISDNLDFIQSPSSSTPGTGGEAGAGVS